MKSRLASYIMAVVTFLIIIVFILLGLILWQEINAVDTSVEPENFQTVISESTNTIDQDIETPEIVENPFDQIESPEDDNKSIDYSQVKINNYFYNQLEEPSKIIYRALQSNKENMKTGTYTIEFGNTFSNILKKENGQEELGDYYQSAIEAYTYDNPDIFYISPKKMYINIETKTSMNGNTYNVYINNGNLASYLADEFSSKAKIDSALVSIENIKNQIVQNRTGNTYQDIKMVHDYLVENLEYDVTISKPNIYNIYGALVNKVSVCEGYARAFKYLMDELNIPCVLVIGSGTNSEGQTEDHAWNYVQVNGIWYAIDVTWDDPVVQGGGRASETSKYRYFLKGSTTFQADHRANRQFTPEGKIFNYPELNNQDY